jgi:hypothetical protein
MAFDIGKLKQKVEGVTAGVAEMGLEKLREALGEFSFCVSRLAEAGFDVREVDINLSVTPTVTAVFKITGKTDEEKLAAAVRENPDKKLLAAVVPALIQVNSLQNEVKVGALRADELEISTVVGMLPNITLRFK